MEHEFRLPNLLPKISPKKTVKKNNPIEENEKGNFKKNGP